MPTVPVPLLLQVKLPILLPWSLASGRLFDPVIGSIASLSVRIKETSLPQEVTGARWMHGSTGRLHIRIYQSEALANGARKSLA